MSDVSVKGNSAYWQEHQKKWSQSGLTQPRYCEHAGISYSAFCYWRQRIKEIAPAQESPRFVQIPSSPLKPHTHPALQLALPNGVRIGIDENVNQSLLSIVLNFVGGI